MTDSPAYTESLKSVSHMFEEINDVTEYRKNGSIAYKCKIALIKEEYRYLFIRRFGTPNRFEFVRIGLCVKYEPNGNIDWFIQYDAWGNVIDSKTKS